MKVGILGSGVVGQAHLVVALEGVGMASDVIGQLRARVERMRSQIVGA